MNIYKNLLSLHGYLRDPTFVDDVEPSYAETYGNKAAWDRVFPPLGHAHAARRQSTPAPPEDLCPTGGCA